MKKLLLIIFLVQNIFAIDASFDIVRKNSIIPTISVNITQESNIKKLGFDIKNLLEKDLAVSGHFKIVNKASEIKSINDKFNYSNKTMSGIDLHADLEIKTNSQKTISLYVKLYDLNKRIILFSKSYTITNKNRFPFLSHKIAITINDTLNAPSIKWMDKFVIFSRYTKAKQSEIVVADYTLSYQKVVVKGGLNIFPKWANKNQSSFYYTSYKDVLPVLIKQNLYTSKSEKILSSQGMVVCSDVSFETNKILLTLAPEGQPDIYIYDTKTKIKKRVTKYSGIDVGGSFIDDENSIVFISDRLSKANIFSKKINSRGVERMVYHGKDNSQATTNKNYIVYSSREKKNEFGYQTFNLYLISTKSDMIRRLTVNGANKFPKFSQDGESVLFTKTSKGKSYLGIIRLNHNKSFLFKLKIGNLQSIDW